MTTLAARGSGTPTTSGTTWATVTNAVDGTAGTNPATYATYTNATASAVGYIEISGYNFSSSIAASDTLNSVTVNLRHFENNTGRFVSVRFQPYDGATAIGTIFTATMATAARNDSTTFPVTLAQLRSSTFKVRVTITGAASTQSRVESIDYVDVTADYTIAPPAVTQAAYRFYADGTETGATALAAQDTGYTADTSSGDVNLQVRARLQSTTAVAVPATDDWQLQWEKNASGSWNDVSAAGAVADSYDETNFALGSSFGVTGGVVERGQSFLGNGGRLTRLSFYLAKIGTPGAGDVTAALYDHTGTYGVSSKPATSAVAVATSTTSVAASTLTATPTFTWTNFDFDGTLILTAATPYIAVVQAPVLGDTSNCAQVGSDNTAPGHGGNFATLSLATAPVWGSGTSSDSIFKVYTAGAVVPYASANLTDAAATTNRLGAGSGSFVAGKVSEDGLVDDLGWTANNYTEVLYSVTLKQADLAPTDTLRFRVLRNGATTDLTYTAYPSVTIGAGGPTDRTGTATGSISLAGTSSGTKEVTATAAGTLTVTGSASGVITHDVIGTATGTLTLTGSAAGSIAAAPVLGAATGSITVAGIAVGVRDTRATAVGALAVAGAATGQKTVTATATSSLTVAGTSSGVRGRPGVATGALTVAGTATGVRTFNGVATGSLSLAGAASGVKTVTATATGQLAVAGTASGIRVFTGTATGTLTVAGTATGQKTVAATATGAIALAGTAAATRQVAATATGQIVFGSSALGLVEGNAVGTAVGTITIGGTATGARGITATASGSLTLSGAATARRGTAGTATGTITVTGLATATKTVTATATGTIGIAGTATGGAPVAFEIVGEWNDETVDALQWGEDTVVEWFMLTAVQVNATATGGFTLGGAATGHRTVTATATGQLALAGSLTGIGETPAGVLFKIALGTQIAQALGSTLVITIADAIAVGDLVVVRAAADNLSATTPTFTCADSGGNTYVTHAEKAQNASAGSGVAGAIMCGLATNPVAAGGTITVTLSGAVVASAAYAESFTGCSNTVRLTPVTNAGLATTATVTSAAALVVGDLIIACAGYESRNASTGDSDVLGGPWSTVVNLPSATGGTDTTRVSVVGQYKIVLTSPGGVTYNQTITGTDWVAMIAILQPA